MKNKILYLLAPIAVTLFTYVFFALGNWEYNPKEWDGECRGIWAGFSCIMSINACIGVYLKGDEK